MKNIIKKLPTTMLTYSASQLFSFSATKAVALVVVISLLLGTIGNNAYAVAQSFNNEQEENTASKFSEGKITSCKDTGSIVTVVNIQDLHCHYQTQQNISNIIKEIDDTYGIKAICVEGGYGQIDTSWLNDIKDENLKQTLTDKLLEEGELTGAEYYVIKNNKKDILKGLDEEKTHKENIKRLSDIIENENKYAKTAERVKYIINKLNKKYVNKESRKFTDIVNKYRQEKIDTAKYYGLMLKYIEKINKEPQKYNNIIKISKTDYPNISKYIQLTSNNKKVKTKQVTVELQQLLTELKQKLSYGEYSRMLADTKNLKNTDKLISYIQYYANENKINLEKYTQLNNFVKLNYINNSLNPVEMIKEETALEDQIRKALSYNLTEYEIAYITSFEQYFEKYLNYGLTCIEWKYFETGIEKFRKLYTKYAVVDRIKEIEKDFDEINKYYQTNETRNSIFIDNITKYITDNKKVNTKQKRNAEQILKDSKEVIVVVSGGYHSEELKDMLSDKNINDIVITPNVLGDIDISSEKYKQIIKGQGKIQSQALAYTLASCMDDTYKAAILYKIAANSVDENTFELIKKSLGNEVEEKVNEKLYKFDDIDKNDRFNEQVVKISNIVWKNVKNITFDLMDIDYRKIDLCMIHLVEELVEEGYILSNGNISDIEFSEFKGLELFGIEPELYGYMPDSLQKALLKTVKENENFPVFTFYDREMKLYTNKDVKQIIRIQNTKKDEKTKEIKTNIISEIKDLNKDERFYLDFADGDQNYLSFTLMSKKDVLRKMGNILNQRKKITRKKNNQIEQKEKNFNDMMEKELNVKDFEDLKTKVIYLQDILKSKSKKREDNDVIIITEDKEKVYYDEAIVKYNEQEGKWQILSHDDINKKYKEIENNINNSLMGKFFSLNNSIDDETKNILKKSITSLKEDSYLNEHDKFIACFGQSMLRYRKGTPEEIKKELISIKEKNKEFNVLKEKFELFKIEPNKNNLKELKKCLKSIKENEKIMFDNKDKTFYNKTTEEDLFKSLEKEIDNINLNSEQINVEQINEIVAFQQKKYQKDLNNEIQKIKGYGTEILLSSFCSQVYMLKDPNAEGFDLITEDGYKVQVKAAKGSNIIDEALEKFPGIPVFAPKEVVEDNFNRDDRVFSYNVSEEVLYSAAEIIFNNIEEINLEKINDIDLNIELKGNKVSHETDSKNLLQTDSKTDEDTKKELIDEVLKNYSVNKPFQFQGYLENLSIEKLNFISEEQSFFENVFQKYYFRDDYKYILDLLFDDKNFEYVKEDIKNDDSKIKNNIENLLICLGSTNLEQTINEIESSNDFFNKYSLWQRNWYDHSLLENMRYFLSKEKTFEDRIKAFDNFFVISDYSRQFDIISMGDFVSLDKKTSEDKFNLSKLKTNKKGEIEYKTKLNLQIFTEVIDLKNEDSAELLFEFFFDVDDKDKQIENLVNILGIENVSLLAHMNKEEIEKLRDFLKELNKKQPEKIEELIEKVLVPLQYNSIYTYDNCFALQMFLNDKFISSLKQHHFLTNHPLFKNKEHVLPYFSYFFAVDFNLWLRNLGINVEALSENKNEEHLNFYIDKFFDYENGIVSKNVLNQVIISKDNTNIGINNNEMNDTGDYLFESKGAKAFLEKLGWTGLTEEIIKEEYDENMVETIKNRTENIQGNITIFFDGHGNGFEIILESNNMAEQKYDRLSPQELYDSLENLLKNNQLVTIVYAACLCLPFGIALNSLLFEKGKKVLQAQIASDHLIISNENENNESYKMDNFFYGLNDYLDKISPEHLEQIKKEGLTVGDIISAKYFIHFSNVSVIVSNEHTDKVNKEAIEYSIKNGLLISDKQRKDQNGPLAFKIDEIGRKNINNNVKFGFMYPGIANDIIDNTITNNLTVNSSVSLSIFASLKEYLKNQNKDNTRLYKLVSVLDNKAHIWENIFFVAPTILSGLLFGSLLTVSGITLFAAFVALFLFSHTIVRWLTDKDTAWNRKSFKDFAKQDIKDLSIPSLILTATYIIPFLAVSMVLPLVPVALISTILPIVPFAVPALSILIPLALALIPATDFHKHWNEDKNFADNIINTVNKIKDRIPIINKLSDLKYRRMSITENINKDKSDEEEAEYEFDKNFAFKIKNNKIEDDNDTKEKIDILLEKVRKHKFTYSSDIYRDDVYETIEQKLIYEYRDKDGNDNIHEPVTELSKYNRLEQLNDRYIKYSSSVENKYYPYKNFTNKNWLLEKALTTTFISENFELLKEIVGSVKSAEELHGYLEIFDELKVGEEGILTDNYDFWIYIIKNIKKIEDFKTIFDIVRSLYSEKKGKFLTENSNFWICVIENTQKDKDFKEIFEFIKSDDKKEKILTENSDFWIYVIKNTKKVEDFKIVFDIVSSLFVEDEIQNERIRFFKDNEELFKNLVDDKLIFTKDKKQQEKFVRLLFDLFKEDKEKFDQVKDYSVVTGQNFLNAVYINIYDNNNGKVDKDLIYEIINLIMEQEYQKIFVNVIYDISKKRKIKSDKIKTLKKVYDDFTNNKKVNKKIKENFEYKDFFIEFTFKEVATIVLDGEKLTENKIDKIIELFDNMINLINDIDANKQTLLKQYGIDNIKRISYIYEYMKDIYNDKKIEFDGGLFCEFFAATGTNDRDRNRKKFVNILLGKDDNTIKNFFELLYMLCNDKTIIDDGILYSLLDSMSEQDFEDFIQFSNNVNSKDKTELTELEKKLNNINELNEFSQEEKEKIQKLVVIMLLSNINSVWEDYWKEDTFYYTRKDKQKKYTESIAFDTEENSVKIYGVSDNGKDYYIPCSYIEDFYKTKKEAGYGDDEEYKKLLKECEGKEKYLNREYREYIYKYNNGYVLSPRPDNPKYSYYKIIETISEELQLCGYQAYYNERYGQVGAFQDSNITNLIEDCKNSGKKIYFFIPRSVTTDNTRYTIKELNQIRDHLKDNPEDAQYFEFIFGAGSVTDDILKDEIDGIKSSKKNFDEELKNNKIDMNDDDGRKKIIKIEKDYAPKCGTYYDKLVEYGIEDKELLDFAFYMKVINLAENKNFDELKNIIEDKDLDIKYRLFALTYFGAENDINEINSDTLKGLREQFIEDFIQNKIQIEEKDNFALRAVSAGIFLIERDKFSNFIDNQNNSIYKNFFEKNLKSVFVNKNTAAGNANAEFYYVYSDKIIRNIAHEQGHFFHSEFSFSSLPLNREGVFNFLEYSAKELFAEVSSAMVCKELHVEFKTTDCLYKLYNNEKYKEYEKYFAQQEYRTAEGLIYLLEAVFSSANEKDVNYELLAMAVSQVLNNCYLYDALKSYPGQREMLLETINPLAANTFKTSEKLISDANKENIDLSNISDQSTMLRNILEVYFIYLKNYGNLDTTVVDNIEEMLKETDSWKALVPELFEKLENYEDYDDIINEIIEKNNYYISYYRAMAHEKLNLEDSRQVIANMVLSRPDKTLEVLNIIEDRINIDGEINEKERDILVLINAIKYAYNENIRKVTDKPVFISAEEAKKEAEAAGLYLVTDSSILDRNKVRTNLKGDNYNWQGSFIGDCVVLLETYILNVEDKKFEKRIINEFKKIRKNINDIKDITAEDVAYYLVQDEHDFGIFTDIQQALEENNAFSPIPSFYLNGNRNFIDNLKVFFENDITKIKIVAKNNNYLNIEQNKNNKEELLKVVKDENIIDAKFKLYALNYLITIHNVDVSQEIIEKIKKDFSEQMFSEDKNIKNNFDLKAYATGIFLLISDDKDKDILEKIMKQAVFVRKNPNEPNAISNDKLEFVFGINDSVLCVNIAENFGCEKEEFEKILNDYKNKTDSDEPEQYQEAFIGKALFSNIPGVSLITQAINRRYYIIKGDIIFNDNWNINDQRNFINEIGKIDKDNAIKYPNLNATEKERNNYRNKEKDLLDNFIKDNKETFDKVNNGNYKGSNNYAYIYYLYRENETKSLKNYLENKNNKIEHRLYALMYLKTLDENIDKKVEKEIKEEYKEKIKTKGYRNNIKNNFDLKAHITGMMLILEKDFTELANIAGKSEKDVIENMYKEIPNAIFLERLPTIYLIKRAYSDLAFSVDFEDDLNDTVIHELMHIFVEKAGFENENEIGLSLNELFAYIASNEYSLNEEDKKDEKKTDSFSFIPFNEEHNFSEMFMEVMDITGEPFTGKKLSEIIVKLMISNEFSGFRNTFDGLSQLELRNKIFDIYLEGKDENFIKDFEKKVNESDFGWQSVLYNTLQYLKKEYPNEYSDIIKAIKYEITDENENMKKSYRVNKSYKGIYSDRIEQKIKNGDADTIAYNVILVGKQPNKKILEIFLNKIPQKEQYLKTVLGNINNKDYLYQEKNKKGDNFLFNATYTYNKQQSNEHQNNIFLYGIEDNFVDNVKVLSSFDTELNLREEAINSKLMDSIINNGNNFILLDFDTMPSDIEIKDVLKDIDLSNSKVHIRYNLNKFNNDKSYEKKLTGLKKKLSELGIPDINIVNDISVEILKQLIRKKINEGNLENLSSPLTFQTSNNFNLRYRYKGLELLVLEDVVYDDDEITDIFNKISEKQNITEFVNKYNLVFKRLNLLNPEHVKILKKLSNEIDGTWYKNDKNKSEELLEICNDLETKIEKKLEEKTKEITDYNKNEIFRDDKIIFNGSVDDRKININIDSEEFFEKYEPMNLYKAFNEIKNKDSSKTLVLGKSDYKHQKYRPNGIKLLDALCGKKAKLWQQYYRENIFEQGFDGGIVAKPYDLIVKINEDINNGNLTDVYFFLNENMEKLDRNNNPSHSFSEILILLDMKENGSAEEQRIAENVIEHTTFVVGTDSFLDFAEDILKDLGIDIGEISTYQLARLFDKIFEWQETKDSEEKESMGKINDAAILPENEDYVNKSISKGKSSLRILLGIAWKEFLNVYNPNFAKKHEEKGASSQQTAMILTITSYLIPAIVGITGLLMPAIPLTTFLIAFIVSIFASNIGVHVILDFKAVKARKELFNTLSKDEEIINSATKGYTGQEEEIVMPVYIVSERIGDIAESDQLKNTGLKTEQGESIFVVKTEGAIILGTGNGASAKDVAQVLNESKVLEKLIKDKIGKNIKVKSDIVVEDKNYIKQKKKEKGFENSNIIFEDGIIIVNKINGQTQTEIINEFKTLSSIKQTIGYTLADKMIISLESIEDKVSLRQSLNNGKARKVITEEQMNDLGLSKAELFKLREEGIEVYIKEGDKIKEFDTKEEIKDIEKVDRNITIQGLQNKIVSSEKSLLIDIEDLKDILKNNQTSDILEVYDMFETLMGNIKTTFGIGQLTEKDVEEMAYNVSFDKIPVKWESLEQNNEIMMMYNSISEDKKKVFKTTIEARIEAKKVIKQVTVENVQIAQNNKNKNLEKLLVKMINKGNIDIDQEQLNEYEKMTGIELEQEYNKIITDIDNNVTKLIVLIPIIMDEKNSKVEKLSDENDSRDYRAMLAAA